MSGKASMQDVAIGSFSFWLCLLFGTSLLSVSPTASLSVFTLKELLYPIAAAFAYHLLDELTVHLSPLSCLINCALGTLLYLLFILLHLSLTFSGADGYPRPLYLIGLILAIAVLIYYLVKSAVALTHKAQP